MMIDCLYPVLPFCCRIDADKAAPNGIIDRIEIQSYHVISRDSNSECRDSRDNNTTFSSLVTFSQVN